MVLCACKFVAQTVDIQIITYCINNMEKRKVINKNLLIWYDWLNQLTFSKNYVHYNKSNCFYLDLFINQVPYCNQFKPK